MPHFKPYQFAIKSKYRFNPVNWTFAILLTILCLVMLKEINGSQTRNQRSLEEMWLFVGVWNTWIWIKLSIDKLKSKFLLSVKSFKKIEPKKVYEFVPPQIHSTVESFSSDLLLNCLIRNKKEKSISVSGEDYSDKLIHFWGMLF